MIDPPRSRGGGAAPPAGASRWRSGWAFAYLIFVVYGSLVPLDLHPIALDEAWRRFLGMPFLVIGAEGRADWIANAVLYFPLGLMAARMLGPGRIGRSAIVGALLACSTLAVSVEFLQLFFPPRTVSLNDLLAESIGAALGALAAPRAGAWWERLQRAIIRQGGDLAPRLLGGYALAYLVLAFFPYDLLLSSQELADKAMGTLWGWWWAEDDRGLAIWGIRWLAEVALAVPFGVLWAWRRRVSTTQALLVGLALGLVVELGQFLLFSGVSQGASVLSRVLGVTLGASVVLRACRAGPDVLRRQLRRSLPWVLPLYLIALALSNGWLRAPQQGLSGAQATWAELRLLPFYYHYYTSEAIALSSLLSVVLMYLPWALWGWAFGWSGRRAAVVAGLLALLVEVSKLFLAGMRPDPTNVLIAAVAVAVAVWSREALRQTASPVETSTTGQAAARRWPSGWGIALALAPVGWALTLPSVGPAVAALLSVIAWLVAWRPLAALVLVPMALPVLDLAPWSGPLWIDEFDLLFIVCCLVAWGRGRAPREAARLASYPLALLGITIAVGVVRALAVQAGVDSPSDPMNPMRALWIAKGAAEAWVFVCLYRRLAGGGTSAGHAVFAGMFGGLVLTLIIVLWERLAFVGLFDFATDYRITGPFSAMHRGGAYVECYLVVGSVFALASLYRAPGWLRAAGAIALALGIYGVMVTYSRNGYVALLLVLVLGAWLLQPASLPRARRLGVGLLVAASVGLIAVLIGGSGLARERIERSQADLRLRQAHWADAIALRDNGVWAELLGAGLGRFPEAHFWRSSEAAHAATQRLMSDGKQSFLRLGPGAPTYIEQLVRVPASAKTILTLELRSAQPNARLAVALCEKWMLTSVNCVEATASSGAAQAWQQVRIELQPLATRAGRTAKLALAAPAAGYPIDVTTVALRSSDGADLLRNGSFSAGMAHWFWSTDVDPPWHIHSLPLSVWFEQGWLGVAAWSAAIAAAVLAALRRWQRGQRGAPVALVALAGFLCSGLVNTLIDVPRFLFLLLLLLWWCTVDDANPEWREPGPSS